MFVVLGHTLKSGPVQNYIWSFQIPLFFFISGMLFKDRGEGFGKYAEDKTRKLLVPYWFFGFICILIYVVLGRFVAADMGIEGLSFDFLTNLKGLLYGSAKTGNLKFNLPLWFLPCMFCTSIIYYFVNRITSKKSAYILAAALIFAAAGYIINYHTALSTLPFGLETSVTMLVFYCLGQYYFKNTPELFNKPVFIIFIVIGGIAGLANGRISYSSDIYNNIILFYISSICGIIGYVALAKFIDHNMVLEYIGKSSLAILVMHKLPIVFFQDVVPFTKKALKNNSLPVALFVSVFSIGCCLLARIIILKIMPWALGKKKEQ